MQKILKDRVIYMLGMTQATSQERKICRVVNELGKGDKNCEEIIRETLQEKLGVTRETIEEALKKGDCNLEQEEPSPNLMREQNSMEVICRIL